ncbi:hypothetical protein K439DRAFT_1357085, partial [Ramaria rubella]
YTAALDYLPIQATSIPSEQLFSSSPEMDTKCRNHIKPELQEALFLLQEVVAGFHWRLNDHRGPDG